MDTTDTPVREEPLLTRPGPALAVIWILLAFGGWIVSFLLYLEYIGQLAGTDAIISCDISPIITCGPNLLSPAGNLLGFTNAIIGIVLFTGPVYAAAGSLASRGLRRWYWIVFALFVTGAFGFVHMLAYRSVFEFGSLCPWCIVVWLVTIPLFWTTLGWTLREGIWGDRMRPAGAVLLAWSPFLVVVNYAVIAVAAQLRLDLIGSLWS